MGSPEASIIIPVHNKWELTRNCLKSVAATTEAGRIEVIVVDNASTDATAQGCQFLGKTLFGENFHFIRNGQNRNFAGACNQGAKAASGSRLIFLNNDTLAESGWYDPLIEDFATYPKIAATGPLLVYPDAGPFGRAVQHLGILVAPFLKFGHLYQHIPETSGLARKRRFFQAITGACFAIPKALFDSVGGFDEGYKNGFEDVDLCARLTGQGYRFTVNPASVVVHLEGQTEGRGKDEGENYQRLASSSLKFMRPDWSQLLAADGLRIQLGEWPRLDPGLQTDEKTSLNSALPKLGLSELAAILRDRVYWPEGWLKLIANLREGKARAVANYFQIQRTPESAALAVRTGRDLRDSRLARCGLNFLRQAAREPEALLAEATTTRDFCQKTGQAGIACLYSAWIANYPQFRTEIYPRYQRQYFSLTQGQ